MWEMKDYMIVLEIANTTCEKCNKILLKSNKPACECFIA